MRASHERHELDGSFRLFRLVAHCSAGPGKLDAWTGRREDARQHLATATAMYREIDVRLWLVEQAEAGLSQQR